MEGPVISDAFGSLAALAARIRRSPLATRLGSWPSATWLAWFDRRVGLYLVSLAAIYGLKWRGNYDLDAFLIGARDVVAGRSAYASTLAAGAGSWGTQQVYVSPPPIAHLLAAVEGMPREFWFGLWTIAGLLALFVAIRMLPSETFARQAPRLVFGLGYVWVTVFLGQVNLFVLSGLLLALGSRNDRAAGLGLAVAGLLRGPVIVLGVELLLQRRWRALAWCAIALAAGIALSDPGEWLTYIAIMRELAAAPTLDVPPQMSLLFFSPLLAVCGGVMVAAVFGLARRLPGEAALMRGTALGLGLVLMPGNAWLHWLTFALAPLLLAADRALWSRRAIAAYLAVAFIPMGWPSVAVSLAVLVAMTRRVVVAAPPRGMDVRAGLGIRVVPAALRRFGRRYDVGQ